MMSGVENEIDLNLDMNTPVDSVNVIYEGFKPRQISALSSSFSTLSNSQTLADVFNNITEINKDLESLFIFRKVINYIDVGKTKNDISVTFKVTPKLYDYKISSFLNHCGELTVDIDGTIPSIFGGLESLVITRETSISSGSDFDVNLKLPKLPYYPHLNGDLRLNSLFANFKPYTAATGSSRSFSFNISDPNTPHNFFWTFKISNLFPVFDSTNIASKALISSPSNYLKHSLKYNYCNFYYSKPDILSSTQFSLELPLPGGSVYLIKSEAFKSYLKTINKNFHLQTNFSGGILHSLFNNNSPFQERFFNSGASGCQRIVKGFKPYGLGPFENGWIKKENNWNKSRDGLGGNTYINAQIALYYNNFEIKPFKNITNPEFFCFTNAASFTENFNKSLIQNFIRDLRLSCGLGFSLPIGSEKLEFSFSKPLLYNKNDNISKFQFGISLRKGDL